MRIGKIHNCKKRPLGIAWVEKSIRILGVHISYDQKVSDELNFENRLVKCKKILNEWSCRGLTMEGRVQIIKTFIISQFLYSVSAIDMSEKYITELNRLIFNFIWRGKKSRLKRSTLCLPKEKGGLNVPDIHNMIKTANVKWIKKVPE